MGTGKPRRLADEGDRGPFGGLPFLAAAPLLDDAVLPGHDLGEIDRDPSHAYPALPGAPRVMGALGAGQHGLGRGAPVVDAGSPQVLAFDQGDGPAPVGQPMRQGIPGLPRPDDNGVELLHVPPPSGLDGLGDKALGATIGSPNPGPAHESLDEVIRGLREIRPGSSGSTPNT